MNHPLKCDKCDNFRKVDYSDKIISADGKSLRIINTPFYKCYNCGDMVCIISDSELADTQSKYFPTMESGKSYMIDMKKISSVLDPDRKFSEYDSLDFNYDSRDYYTIPGLYSPEDDGYLTPVFFDKDVLLYYNNHPDYQVKLYSFTSGNIYYKGNILFEWGFGINRSGKIFKWLGDLESDFKENSMRSHWKRFQASNIDSDHDVFSKFYLSQNPYSIKDAFQKSDNENRIFKLKNDFDTVFKNKFGFDYSKLIGNVFNHIYKHPILNERNQIFEAYLSLNKILAEGIDTKKLKEKLIDFGIQEIDLKGLGSLKSFGLFIEKVLKYGDWYNLMTPFFVLNDLRNLHGHLNDTSFKTDYNDCAKRLGLTDNETDYIIYETLIQKLINSFEILINHSNQYIGL